MNRRPVGAEPDASRSAARRIVCERCRSRFHCSRDDRGGCWCGAEPYRLPTPLPPEVGNFADCLCASCLREIAERLMEARRGRGSS